MAFFLTASSRLLLSKSAQKVTWFSMYPTLWLKLLNTICWPYLARIYWACYYRHQSLDGSLRGTRAVGRVRGRACLRWSAAWRARGRQSKSTSQSQVASSKPSSYLSSRIIIIAKYQAVSRRRALRQEGVSLSHTTALLSSCQSAALLRRQPTSCAIDSSIPVNFYSISAISCCLSISSSSRSSSTLSSSAFFRHTCSTRSSIRSTRKALWAVCVPLSLLCTGFLVINCEILALQWAQLDTISLIYSFEFLDKSSGFLRSVSYQWLGWVYLLSDLPDCRPFA